MRTLSNFKPVEQLDEVLNLLKSTDDSSLYLNYLQMIGIVATIPDIDKVVNQLRIDGYVEKSTSIVTFKGEVLIEEGGYKELKRRERVRSHLQSAQTLVICAGTGIAGIYYFVELTKWIWSLLPCHCN